MIKKRRKLKKWVKKSLYFFAIITFIIFFYCASIILKDDNSSNDDINSNNNIYGEELNRYIYKEGFYYEDLSKKLKSKITGGSYPIEFSNNFEKITYDDLNYVRVKYYDFDGMEHSNGELIINKLVAQDIVEIFYKLYLEKYPINSIKLVEEFNSSDELSMRANNTSAFCYRIVENVDRLSWHAFGLAVDINPLFNPYIVGNVIYPETATSYIDRSLDFIGKIDHNDLVYIVFKQYGWKWGGDFVNTKDYQHFYKEIFDDSIRERSE